MAEVTIHPLAEAEYEAAPAGYFDQSPQAADGFETAFGAAITAIQSHPTMDPKCDDGHRSVLLKRSPYSVVYRCADDSARVIAVVHSKRRPGYWSGREG